MKHYDDFTPSGEDFASRTGPPEEFDAALGRIVLGFSFLEDSVANVTSLLIGSPVVGSIVSAELAFKQKLDVMASLVWDFIRSRPASPAARRSDGWLEENVRELLAICRRSEDLRNQHLHSRYSRTVRVKTSAKAKRGLFTAVSPISPGILLDVADFIVCTGMAVEELPLLLGLADSVGGNGLEVVYTRDRGRTVVGRFSFGETRLPPNQSESLFNKSPEE